MPQTLDHFLQNLTESNVLSENSVKELVRRTSIDGQPLEAQHFARELVRLKKLTPYQAQVIYQGKGKSLVLGNYVILNKLGQGGMGAVFKARHRRMERIVALKVLSLGKDESLQKRFHREVVAAAKLFHPNIVAAYDADEAKGTHFLVMEFVDGKDLASHVKKRGPLSVSQAVDCVIQTARGLEYAHQQGVVHRDIKPQNLLLDTNGMVKILDMGLARLDSGVTTGSSIADASITQSGMIMGTVDYMSPEQALDTKRADSRSDIYSLGCTLFFLLTGKVCYYGDTLMKRLLGHREGPAPSLTAVRPDVPSALDSVFQKMIAKEPEQRFQTMTEVIAALSQSQTASHTPVQPLEAETATTDEDDLAGFFRGLVEQQSAGPGVATRAESQTSIAQRTETLVVASESDTLKIFTTSGRSTAAKRHPTVAYAIGGGVLAVLIVVVAASLANRGGKPAESVSKSRLPGEEYVRFESGPKRPRMTVSSRPTIKNYALDFSGSSRSRIEFPTLAYDNSHPLTIDVLVTATNSDAAFMPIISNKDRSGSGLLLRVSDRIIELNLKDRGAYKTALHSVPKPDIVQLERTHVACVIDASRAMLFVSGKLVSTVDVSDLDVSAEAFVIGKSAGPASGAPFRGMIDEIRFSRSVRYRNDFSPHRRFEPDADTIALYHCDEGDGTGLSDASGNGHHGIVVDVDWRTSDQ